MMVGWVKRVGLSGDGEDNHRMDCPAHEPQMGSP